MEAVYCLTSIGLEECDYYKVGRTTHNQIELESQYTRYLPSVKTKKFVKVNDSTTSERSLHEALKAYRVGKSEWFRCPIRVLSRIWNKTLDSTSTKDVGKKIVDITDDEVEEQVPPKEEKEKMGGKERSKGMLNFRNMGIESARDCINKFNKESLEWCWENFPMLESNFLLMKSMKIIPRWGEDESELTQLQEAITAKQISLLLKIPEDGDFLKCAQGDDILASQLEKDCTLLIKLENSFQEIRTANSKEQVRDALTFLESLDNGVGYSSYVKREITRLIDLVGGKIDELKRNGKINKSVHKNVRDHIYKDGIWGNFDKATKLIPIAGFNKYLDPDHHFQLHLLTDEIAMVEGVIESNGKLRDLTIDERRAALNLGYTVDILPLSPVSKLGFNELAVTGSGFPSNLPS